jgi:Copper type II ascorbate-dependent monooxygenase, C-terminal domain
MKKIILIAVGAMAFAGCQKTITYNKADIPKDFVGLPPLSADSGVQFHIEPFPIPANFEREFFIRKDLNNTQDIYINRFRCVSRPGTHHFVLSDMEETPAFPLPLPNVIVDQNNIDGTPNLFSFSNRSNTIFIAQSADYELELPAGYGLRLSPNYKFLCNPHYFNKTNATRYGEVFLNLYTLPKEKVTKVIEMDQLDGNEKLILPPNKETTITTDLIFEKRTQLITMSPHYHKLGKKIVVQIVGGPRNGEVVLESEDYQHPNVGFYINKPLVLEAGQGLRSITTYNNNTNSTVGYGVTSADEMNYVFLYTTTP